MNKYYVRDKAAYLARANKSNKKIKARLRGLVREAKNKPCKDCGGTFNYWQMDLDHVSGEKINGLAVMVSRCASEETVKTELEKCEAVCANCHRNRTHFRQFGIMGEPDRG